MSFPDTGYEEALDHAQRSVALKSEAYNQDTLALVYYKLKRYNEALEHYNQALTLAPAQLASLEGRGDVFLALGEPQKARLDYQAYLDLAPEGPERAEVEAKFKALTGD